MDTTPRSGPKDFFMYLFAFGTFYASVASLITLWFAYIDQIFLDPLSYPYGYTDFGLEQVRWPMAMLIVFVPVYLILSRMIGNDMAANPDKKDARVYKLLVYMTLFLAGLTIVIDLVALVYNFLGGDLTSRFFLKILVVFVLALAVFLYYRWHLTADLAAERGRRTMFFWLAIAAVVASIVAGFFILGSPMNQRKARFDERRVNDLQMIQSQIVGYWQSKQRLPATLDDLTDNISGFAAPVDPETKMLYEYRLAGTLSFQLCATFASDSENPKPGPLYPVGTSDSFNIWAHGEGRFCYDRTIDPEFYKR